ncbi:MAG TPA: cytochrome b/b6 domain-containing protein [Marmoricola sp.]|nr:cytochrome b/b6 domain-containing protein [Marmoricola sp.]
MGARNGEHGYGYVTIALHWFTVLLVLAQFVVGYVMASNDDLDIFPLHQALGASILVIAIGRVAWRVSTPLPPWADSLSSGERKVAHWTERILLALLFVIPATGLILAGSGDDDLLPLHVAAHVAFFVTLAVHLGLVLGRGLRGRPVLLERMLRSR